MTDYFDNNRRLWDDWTEAHLRSEFYDLDAFVGGQPSLHPLEIAELGDVSGKRLLHLQCHFGMDTLSWARLGATVTGVDFSPRAIDEARALAARIGVDDATFVCADVLALDDEIDGAFDVIYTGGGALGWLPSLDRWGAVIARFLTPGGTFYLREFHPFMWVFDDDPSLAELGGVRYPYFAHEAPIVFPVEGSYADPSAAVSVAEHYTWAHPFEEIFGALLGHGLQITYFKEHAHTSKKLFPWTEQRDDGNWYVRGGDIPQMFSLTATK